MRFFVHCQGRRKLACPFTIVGGIGEKYAQPKKYYEFAERKTENLRRKTIFLQIFSQKWKLGIESYTKKVYI